MDKLKVTLPKFSIRGSLELNEPLASLNISKLFGAGGPHIYDGNHKMVIWRSFKEHGDHMVISCFIIMLRLKSHWIHRSGGNPS